MPHAAIDPVGSIPANLFRGGAVVTRQGAGGLKALLEEIREAVNTVIDGMVGQGGAANLSALTVGVAEGYEPTGTNFFVADGESPPYMGAFGMLDQGTLQPMLCQVIDGAWSITPI